MKLKIAAIIALALAGTLYFGQSAIAGEGCCPVAKAAADAKKEACDEKKKEECTDKKKEDCADKKDCDKSEKATECKVDTAK